MIVRSVFVMLLLTLTGSPLPQTETATVGYLLLVRPLSDEITTLSVTDQTGRYLVQLSGQSRREGEKNPAPFSSLAIQVWLLRTNGTTVRQQRNDSGGIASGGFLSDFVTFTFDHIPASELAGVVVRVNGKLLLHEISAK